MTMSATLKAAAVLAALGAAGANAAPVTVTTSTNAAALAGALVGSGVTVSNATLTGAPSAVGTFTGGTGAGLGFDTGIVLTSGTAAAAGTSFAGANQPDNAVGGPSTPLIASSFDSATLSFSFSSTGTAASFSYVFASAEYPEFVNSQFNDAFRFLVNGTDIATLPGSSTLVSINTVNNGDANGAGASNPSLFVDNRTGANSSLPYGGSTVRLSAGVTGLTPGALNTLTLVIADVNDALLDSAVFIQAGSLTNAPPGTTPPATAVPEPATAALLGAGLLGLGFRRRARG